MGYRVQEKKHFLLWNRDQGDGLCVFAVQFGFAFDYTCSRSTATFFCVLQREKIITEAGTPHKTGLPASAFIAPVSRGQESKSFFMFCSSVDFM